MRAPGSLAWLERRACLWGGDGLGTDGNANDGSTGAGPGGSFGDAQSGGGSETPGYQGEASVSDHALEGNAPVGLLGQIGDAARAALDSLFGAPRTGDRVADLAISAWTSAIPGAGMMMGLANAARDAGYSVDDSGNTHGMSGNGADGGNSWGPYRPTGGNPLAPVSTAPAAPAWAGSGALSASPYIGPMSAAAPAPAGSVAALGGETPPDAYTPPEETAQGAAWPVILVGAALLAGLTL
jgi:hypothetical protein